MLRPTRPSEHNAASIGGGASAYADLSRLIGVAEAKSDTYFK
jgi:hypothetical protein